MNEINSMEQLLINWSKILGINKDALFNIIKSGSFDQAMLGIEEDDPDNISFEQSEDSITSMTLNLEEMSDQGKDIWPSRERLERLLNTWPSDLKIRRLGIFDCQTLAPDVDSDNNLIDEENPYINGIDLFDLHLPSLKTLAIADAQIKSINLSNCPALEELTIWGNPIDSLDVSRNRQLKSLYISYTFIEKVIVSSISKLESLTIEFPDGPHSIDESGFKKTFDLFDVINLSDSKNLKTLNIEHIGISSIDTSNFFNLSRLSIKSIPIYKIDLRYNTNLLYVDISDTLLEEVDLSNCDNIEQITYGSSCIKKIFLSKTAKPELIALPRSAIPKIVRY